MAEEDKPEGYRNRPPRDENGQPRKRARKRTRRRGPRRDGEGGGENTNGGNRSRAPRGDGENRQGGQRRKGPRNNTRDTRSNGEGRGNQNRGNAQKNRRGPRRQPEPELTLLQKVMKFFGFYTPPAAPERGMKKGREEKERRPRRADVTPHGAVEGEEASPPRKKRNRKRKPQGETHQREDTTQAKKDVKSGELYIGNLSYDASEHDLQDLFSGVGSVRKVEVIYNKHTHRSKGYAFIRMSNTDEAKRAVDVLHDQYFLGRRMVVNAAKDRASYATTDEPLREQKPEGSPENPPESKAPTAAPTPEQIKARKEEEERKRVEAEEQKKAAEAKKSEEARAAEEAEEKAKAETAAANEPTAGVPTTPVGEPAAPQGEVISEPVGIDLTEKPAGPPPEDKKD